MITCEEFRKRFHAELDVHASFGESEDLEPHLLQCPECAAYARTHVKLHELLRTLPRVNPSLELLESLHSFEKPSSLPKGWRFRLRTAQKAFLLLLPVLLIVAIRSLGQTAITVLAEFTFNTITLFVLAKTILRPIVLGDSGK